MGLKLLIIFLLLASIVFALPDSIRLPKMPPLEEKEIMEGQNATLSLTGFTKALLKLHEGTRIDFNVYNENSRELEAINSLIIKQINPNEINVLLSVDGIPYEESIIKLGDNVQLNYTNKYVPFMFIQLQKLRYFEYEDGIAKHATIFFNVPLITRVKQEIVKQLDVSNVMPTEFKKQNYTKFYILGILGLIVSGFLLFKSKHHSK